VVAARERFPDLDRGLGEVVETLHVDWSDLNVSM
jgi:hypothetical protein